MKKTKKIKNKKQPTVKIAKEVINLSNTINKIDGLKTVQSTSGSGKDPVMIFFDVTKVKALPVLLFYLRHFGKNCRAPNNWFCEAYTDCAGTYPYFLIMSVDVGRKAYRQANQIAKCIKEDLAETKRK